MSVSASSPPPAGASPLAFFSHLKADVPAGLVVFLVATPLCLGIAQASGAPLLSGLIAGVVGGLVVAGLSRSPLSVSGPAAGLAVLVAAGIAELGFRPFLLAVSLAGLMQLAVGALRLGGIAHFFPSSVIKGMLAAIGLLIVFKQLPHAVGYDANWQGDEAFRQADGHNTFSALVDAFAALTPAATLITVVCAGAYLLWPRLQRAAAPRLLKQVLQQVPTPLVAVVVGGVLVAVLPALWPAGALGPEHLVALPVFQSMADVGAALVTPDFTAITDPRVWTTAATLCVVASIETLLSIEAIDRLDPERRISPPNRELVAQGVGNTLSGLLGGLPVTSVIVRSSANVQAGAKTRLSAMTHGAFLLIGVLLLPTLLNMVPLAALAVVLIVIGAKLAAPRLWREMWRAGYSQFVPFLVTVVAIVFTDLLKGTLIGLLVGIAFAVRRQQQNAIIVVKHGTSHFIRFAKDLTFLQKARIKDVLLTIPDGASVVIDRERVDFVDDDVEELLAEFAEHAPGRGILLEENLGPQALARRRALSFGH